MCNVWCLQLSDELVLIPFREASDHLRSITLKILTSFCNGFVSGPSSGCPVRMQLGLKFVIIIFFFLSFYRSSNLEMNAIGLTSNTKRPQPIKRKRKMKELTFFCLSKSKCDVTVADELWCLFVFGYFFFFWWCYFLFIYFFFLEWFEDNKRVSKGNYS